MFEIYFPTFTKCKFQLDSVSSKGDVHNFMVKKKKQKQRNMRFFYTDFDCAVVLSEMILLFLRMKPWHVFSYNLRSRCWIQTRLIISTFQKKQMKCIGFFLIIRSLLF